MEINDPFNKDLKPFQPEDVPQIKESDKEIENVAKILFKNCNDYALEKNILVLKDRFQKIHAKDQISSQPPSKPHLLKDCKIFLSLIEMKLQHESDPKKRALLKDFSQDLKQMEKSLEKLPAHDSKQTQKGELQEEKVIQKEEEPTAQISHRLLKLNKTISNLVLQINSRSQELFQSNNVINPDQIKSLLEDIKIVEGIIKKLDSKYAHEFPNTERLLISLDETKERLTKLSLSGKETKDSEIKTEVSEPYFSLEMENPDELLNLLKEFKADFNKIKQSKITTEDWKLLHTKIKDTFQNILKTKNVSREAVIDELSKLRKVIDFQLNLSTIPAPIPPSQVPSQSIHSILVDLKSKPNEEKGFILSVSAKKQLNQRFIEVLDNPAAAMKLKKELLSSLDNPQFKQYREVIEHLILFADLVSNSAKNEILKNKIDLIVEHFKSIKNPQEEITIPSKLVLNRDEVDLLLSFPNITALKWCDLRETLKDLGLSDNFSNPKSDSSKVLTNSISFLFLQYQLSRFLDRSAPLRMGDIIFEESISPSSSMEMIETTPTSKGMFVQHFNKGEKNKVVVAESIMDKNAKGEVKLEPQNIVSLQDRLKRRVLRLDFQALLPKEEGMEAEKVWRRLLGEDQYESGSPGIVDLLTENKNIWLSLFQKNLPVSTSSNSQEREEGKGSESGSVRTTGTLNFQDEKTGSQEGSVGTTGTVNFKEGSEGGSVRTTGALNFKDEKTGSQEGSVGSTGTVNFKEGSEGGSVKTSGTLNFKEEKLESEEGSVGTTGTVNFKEGSDDGSVKTTGTLNFQEEISDHHVKDLKKEELVPLENISTIEGLLQKVYVFLGPELIEKLVQENPEKLNDDAFQTEVLLISLIALKFELEEKGIKLELPDLSKVNSSQDIALQLHQFLEQKRALSKLTTHTEQLLGEKTNFSTNSQPHEKDKEIISIDVKFKTPPYIKDKIPLPVVKASIVDTDVPKPEKKLKFAEASENNAQLPLYSFLYENKNEKGYVFRNDLGEMFQETFNFYSSQNKEWSSFLAEEAKSLNQNPKFLQLMKQEKENSNSQVTWNLIRDHESKLSFPSHSLVAISGGLGGAYFLVDPTTQKKILVLKPNPADLMGPSNTKQFASFILDGTKNPKFQEIRSKLPNIVAQSIVDSNFYIREGIPVGSSAQNEALGYQFALLLGFEQITPFACAAIVEAPDFKMVSDIVEENDALFLRKFEPSQRKFVSSIQPFVENSESLDSYQQKITMYIKTQKIPEDLIEFAFEKDFDSKNIIHILLFEMLTGETDPNPGNYLVVSDPDHPEKKKLLKIDNALIFSTLHSDFANKNYETVSSLPLFITFPNVVNAPLAGEEKKLIHDIYNKKDEIKLLLRQYKKSEEAIKVFEERLEMMVHMVRTYSDVSVKEIFESMGSDSDKLEDRRAFPFNK